MQNLFKYSRVKAARIQLRSVVVMWPLLMVLLSGCGTLLYEENPEAIKREQQASLDSPGPNLVAGESLKSYFHERSALIMPASNVHRDGSGTFSMDRWGWAAALPPDGYYLTSGHVVIQETPVLCGGQYGLSFFDGRVVRMFKYHDLAIVKFANRPSRYFENWGTVPGQGEIVYSAGNYGLEPFETKGTVTGVEEYSKDRPTWSISCTLPTMAGMSGAPVTNGNGDLLGVIRGSSISRFTGKTLSTKVTMLQGASIKEVIDEDRKKQISRN